MSAARMKAHAHARHLLESGAYRDAIRVLEQTIELHGPHVSLFGDLAEAALLSGDKAALHRYMLIFEQEFRAARPLLHEGERTRAQATLDRYLTELKRAA